MTMPFISTLSSQTDECSDGGFVKTLSAFLWLDGVDQLFDVPHLGGKDNLPSMVITIVHQHHYLSLTLVYLL